MQPKKFSLMMKAVIIALAVFGAGFYFYFVPEALKVIDNVKLFTDKTLFLPWLLLIVLTCIPCYAVLILAWKMAQSVQADKQFSHKNSGRLKKIALCALADTAFFFIGSLVYWALGINIPIVVVMAAIILFVGIAFAAAADVLAGMVEKAAILQEENDLTI